MPSRYSAEPSMRSFSLAPDFFGRGIPSISIGASFFRFVSLDRIRSLISCMVSGGRSSLSLRLSRLGLRGASSLEINPDEERITGRPSRPMMSLSLRSRGGALISLASASLAFSARRLSGAMSPFRPSTFSTKSWIVMSRQTLKTFLLINSTGTSAFLSFPARRDKSFLETYCFIRIKAV